MSTPPLILRISRRFAASPERVFDAWLDPAKARRFLFATPGGEMLAVEIDPRVGGGFRIVERRPGGDASHFGSYLEIDRPRRLVFRFAVEPDAPGDRVTIEISALADGCELTLTHEMDAAFADYKERTQAGWTHILEGLEAVAEAG